MPKTRHAQIYISLVRFGDALYDRCMNEVYNFSQIEQKWQQYWEANKVFEVHEDMAIPKEKRKYILDMFPYPSAAGLHVGHPEGYTATDIYTRYLRAKGFHVLHPMGFDSFGLPAETYALKTGTHPRVITEKNIENFRKQIKSLGFSYDWSREVSTHTPEYYQWTQWIFLQLYKKGLAYESEMPVWFCPELGTVLANEEVLQTPDGPRSERGNHPTERRPLRQWMLKITEYAEQLLDGLETLDWPESIKSMQRNWIGKSEGAEVNFSVIDIEKNKAEKITVFTTRPDTLWGATYMVIAPEHPLTHTLTTPEKKSEIAQYLQTTALKSDLERTELSKEKTGVFTGSYAINPVNGKNIPIWISDYILIHYGTGAIMAVPAHDTRDWEFAKKFALPITQVIAPLVDDMAIEDAAPLEEAFVGEGVLVNSDAFSGLPTKEAKSTIIVFLEEHDIGVKKINYKLRDWIFSRQRYWGEPIPVVHRESKEIVAIDESELPLLLPEVDNYAPSGTGESPLSTIKDWVECKDAAGNRVLRETNTMPQWAGSCWYYLRYVDPKNTAEFASKKNIDYWLPVDLYLGGAEHAVLHLLYARFWHKVLFDLGLVHTAEPFQKLINQGMILGEDGNKMSKSLGNVINPDEVIHEYGADSLRLYEMFMGPLRQEKPWATNGLVGIHRFLKRVWILSQKPMTTDVAPLALQKILHKSIKKITADSEVLAFNTAIAQMMIFTNEMSHYDVLYKEIWEKFVILIAPYAPHLGEELWEKLGHNETISFVAWPTYDEALTIDDEIELVLQVNGKVREKISLARDTPKETLETLALENEKIRVFIGAKPIRKVIVVPNKLVNIVV